MPGQSISAFVYLINKTQPQKKNRKNRKKWQSFVRWGRGVKGGGATARTASQKPNEMLFKLCKQVCLFALLSSTFLYRYSFEG